MTIKDVVDKLELVVDSGEGLLEKCVEGCYIGDLLSLARSTGEKDNIWITIQTNVNIAAVASLTEAACVILPDGCVPDEGTLKKAQMQDIVILGSTLSAYALAKKLAGMGV